MVALTTGPTTLGLVGMLGQVPTAGDLSVLGATSFELSSTGGQRQWLGLSVAVGCALAVIAWIVTGM